MKLSSKLPTQAEITADRLHSSAIQLLRRLRREDDVGGLNAPRLSALSMIVFTGPISLGALAEAEQVRAPTMTKIVHALEKLGLVTRQTEERDRRSSKLTATATGKRVMAEGRQRRVTLLGDRISAFSADEQELLRHAADLILRLLQDVVISPQNLISERSAGPEEVQSGKAAPGAARLPR